MSKLIIKTWTRGEESKKSEENEEQLLR